MLGLIRYNHQSDAAVVIRVLRTVAARTTLLKALKMTWASPVLKAQVALDGCLPVLTTAAAFALGLGAAGADRNCGRFAERPMILLPWERAKCFDAL